MMILRLFSAALSLVATCLFPLLVSWATPHLMGALLSLLIRG